jgi:4-amino-4-deoxy-L-arabinose transferase-like glycosyltransferase
MSRNLTRILVWGSRLLCVAIALWWPRLWYDPIYTPRQARLSGQELHLPSGTVPHTQDERAMAIFWEWQQRKHVTAEWGADSFRGVRDPQGRFQTFFMICLVFGVSSGILYFFAPKDPAGLAQTLRRTGIFAIFTTPVWRIFSSRSHPRALSRS